MHKSLPFPTSMRRPCGVSCFAGTHLVHMVSSSAAVRPPWGGSQLIGCSCRKRSAQRLPCAEEYAHFFSPVGLEGNGSLYWSLLSRGLKQRKMICRVQPGADGLVVVSFPEGEWGNFLPEAHKSLSGRAEVESIWRNSECIVCKEDLTV